MTTPFINNGQPFTNNGKPFLVGPPAPPPSPVYSGLRPTDISTVAWSGWWYAGGLTAPSGNTTFMNGAIPVTQWRQPVSKILNQIPAAAADMTVTGDVPTTNYSGPVCVPRLMRLFGGVWGETFEYQPIGQASGNPTVSPNLSSNMRFRVANMQFGSSFSWFRYVVCSQPSGLNSAWASFGGTTYIPVMACYTSGAGGATRLIDVVQSGGSWDNDCAIALFNGATTITAATLAGLGFNLNNRWTHSFALQYNSATGFVTLFLDDVVVSSSLTLPGGWPTTTATTSMYLLENGSTGNGHGYLAFHEAITAERILTSGELAQFFTNSNSVSKLWADRGVRQGYRIFNAKQSNGGFFEVNGAYFNSGKFNLMELTRYYLSSLSVTLEGEGAGGVAMVGATGFINNVAAGTSPTDPLGLIPGNAPWPYGPLGTTFATHWSVLPTYVRARDAFVFHIFWNEGDAATFAYSFKSTYTAILRQIAVLVRGTTALSNAQLPMVYAMPLAYATTASPYTGSGQGITMQREILTDLTDPAGIYATENWQNWFKNTSMADTYNGYHLPDGTLVANGDFGSHLSTASYVNLGQLYPAAAAKTFMAMGPFSGEYFTSIPAGVPLTGPLMTVAHYEGQVGTSGTSTVLVTVTHDANLTSPDLIVPNKASIGDGWTITVGASAGAPTAVWQATAAVYVNSTQVRVTFPTVFVSLTNTRMYYKHNNDAPTTYAINLSTGLPVGVSPLGLINAITDNSLSLAKPVGWNVLADYGPAWCNNLPVQTTTYGVQLT